MKSCSDFIAHGLAISIAIVISALAVEVKQDARANLLELQPQKQALKALRQERKILKINRKERRIERRDRRKDRHEVKPVSKVAR
jgi:hypothetical protein